MEIKCKVCGGRLLFADGEYSAECDSCGISQFLFDYLDKDSEDYQEQVQAIKEEAEHLEQLYLEYADDVINADSYCLTSEDFAKIIRFFEKCGEYKEAPKLLQLAKMCFIGKVSSFADCLKAIDYLEEIDDFTCQERESYKQHLYELAAMFTAKDLMGRGYVVALPQEHSDKNMLAVMEKLLEVSEKSTASLNELEKEIVAQRFSQCVAYIEANIQETIKNATDPEALRKIWSLLPKLKEQFAQIQMQDIESLLNEKVGMLETQRRIVAQQQNLEEQQKKRKERLRKIGIWAIVVSLLLGLLVMGIQKANGYSSKWITIEVLSKTNVKFNEDMADGYVGAGYFYDFILELTNDGPNDVEYIQGQLEILREDGKTLASSSLQMYCDLEAESSVKHKVQLNLRKGTLARELWDTELEDLTIRFRIKEIRFADGTRKEYAKTKSEVIYS